MPEKRIIVDRYEAANVRRRLVDPRRIKQIVLVATEDQPPISGYKTEGSMVYSAWAATNKTCYSMRRELTQPELAVHIGRGSGVDSLVDHTMQHANELIDKVPRRVRVRVQFKSIPNYPAQRGGPREFGLLTVAEDDSAQKSEVLIIGVDEIVPECDVSGQRLVEISVDPNRETSI